MKSTFGGRLVSAAVCIRKRLSKSLFSFLVRPKPRAIVVYPMTEVTCLCSPCHLATLA